MNKEEHDKERGQKNTNTSLRVPCPADFQQDMRVSLHGQGLDPFQGHIKTSIPVAGTCIAVVHRKRIKIQEAIFKST